MNDTLITVIGNIVAAPALRHTQSGIPVTSFRLASTARRKDAATGQWSDGERFFVTVNCWRNQAENVARSVQTGDPVIVHGRIVTREYTVNEANRSSYEIDADNLGLDLTRGWAQFTRRRRESATWPASNDAPDPEAESFAAPEDLEAVLVSR